MIYKHKVYFQVDNCSVDVIEKDSEEELEASAIDCEEMDNVEAEEQSVSEAEMGGGGQCY